MASSPTQFATPDPIFTTEGIGAFVVMIVSNVVILAGLDLSDQRKAAIGALVTAAWILGTFIHGSVVRKGRALGSASR